ncbi:unnamed protein product [Sympodiomycopsis kandeliae]
MQVTSFVTVALLAVTSAVSAASINTEKTDNVLQKRADLRQLFKYPGGNPTDACNKWRCACINYVPKDQTLHFVGAVCEPGDYQGQNMDTEVKAACAFGRDGDRVPTSINKHTAATVGWTFA